MGLNFRLQALSLVLFRHDFDCIYFRNFDGGTNFHYVLAFLEGPWTRNGENVKRLNVAGGLEM
jgi:hypothetical protein